MLTICEQFEYGEEKLTTIQNKTIRLARIAAVSIFALAAGAANAFTPERDVTTVVTSSAGGGSDIVTRTLGEVIRELKLTDSNVLVENRTGGSGAVGYTYVAGKAGDEYMWANIGVSFFTTPLLGDSPVKYSDFTPLAAIAEDAYVMIVRPDSPIKSLADVKTEGRMLSGTTGVVADPALIAKKMESAMGIGVDIVPFEGDGEVMAALLGGHIDVQFGNPSEVLPLIQSGEVRAVAVTSGARLASLPDVPTMTEQGYDVELTQLRGFVMPPKVSDEVTGYWADVIQKAVESPQWKERYVDRFNVVPKFLSGDDFKAEMDKRNALYTELMQGLGLIKQ